ncbi:MAG TPA: hypothetical protein VJH88_02140 [Candidatus Nanoarchaeia archaeon]|nr:hypothetical protein [Candidatus Nanoarchaeia archaeon]
MVIGDILLQFVTNIFKILIAPITHLDMLWIIIPVYLNWVLSEIYQEKKGTSFGNAIANGFVALWVGVDWMRITVDLLSAKGVKLAAVLPKALPKMGFAALMGVYGLGIIIMGMKGSKFVSYLGRVREVTYLTIMITPIFYGIVEPTLGVLLSIAAFFPLFYGIVELLLYMIPTPRVYEEEKNQNENSMPLFDRPSFPPRSREQSHLEYRE